MVRSVTRGIGFCLGVLRGMWMRGVVRGLGKEVGDWG